MSTELIENKLSKVQSIINKKIKFLEEMVKDLTKISETRPNDINFIRELTYSEGQLDAYQRMMEFLKEGC